MTKSKLCSCVDHGLLFCLGQDLALNHRKSAPRDTYHLYLHAQSGQPTVQECGFQLPAPSSTITMWLVRRWLNSYNLVGQERLLARQWPLTKADGVVFLNCQALANSAAIRAGGGRRLGPVPASMWSEVSRTPLVPNPIYWPRSSQSSQSGLLECRLRTHLETPCFHYIQRRRPKEFPAAPPRHPCLARGHYSRYDLSPARRTKTHNRYRQSWADIAAR